MTIAISTCTTWRDMVQCFENHKTDRQTQTLSHVGWRGRAEDSHRTEKEVEGFGY